MENWAGEPGPARGQGGPLQVRRFEKTDRACSAWVESALHQELAPYVTDHNVGINEGISLNQASQFAGRRSSAAIAYVRPALKRGALEVKTGVFVEKLLLSGGRCTGIEVRTETGTQQWRARREVIVCGGAIASPKLLMLSGIGAAESLEPHGIKVLHELRGVGANLNEHINIKLSASSTTRTYSSEKKGWRQAANGARWMVSRDGPASSPVGHVQAFFKTDPALAAADIQVQVIPMGFDRAYTMDVDAVSSVISLCQPKARGRISLRSADPAAAPHITIPLLSDDDDVRRLARACDMVRSVHASAKLRGAMGDELSPGPGTGGSLDAWRAVLQEFGGLNWHPTSTCRMGNGPDDVVDLALKVHGIDGLRIIDGSVMPSVTSGNTNAPIIAMAEKAADLIASSVH
jgi:choline dehydrogenase